MRQLDLKATTQQKKVKEYTDLSFLWHRFTNSEFPNDTNIQNQIKKIQRSRQFIFETIRNIRDW